MFFSGQPGEACRVRSPRSRQDFAHPGDDGRCSLGGGVLKRLLLQAGAAQRDGASLIQKLQSAARLEVPTWVHGNRCFPLEHGSLKQLNGRLALATGPASALEQLAEVFGLLLAHARSRHEMDLPELLSGGELHPICWKSILHEAGANRFGGGVIAERCYKYCTHGSQTATLGSAAGIIRSRIRM